MAISKKVFRKKRVSRRQRKSRRQKGGVDPNPENEPPIEEVNKSREPGKVDVEGLGLTRLWSRTGALNPSIHIINCADNKLTSLPELPDGLGELDCRNNQLTQLPRLPGELGNLYCDNNQLIKLPDLPFGLYDLSCTNNKLEQLPNLPTGLGNLYCNNNQLTRLPDLPDSLEIFNCSNNPLTSLPPTLPEKTIALILSFDQAELLTPAFIEAIATLHQHMDYEFTEIENLDIIIIDIDDKKNVDADTLMNYNKKWGEIVGRMKSVDNVILIFQTPKAKERLGDMSNFKLVKKSLTDDKRSVYPKLVEDNYTEIKKFLGGRTRKTRKKRKHRRK